jgi:hypothetical protein
MLQEPRRPQIRGVKGEAAYIYREPLATKEMQPHTAFPASGPQASRPEGRVKNRATFNDNPILPKVNSRKERKFLQRSLFNA